MGHIYPSGARIDLVHAGGGPTYVEELPELIHTDPSLLYILTEDDGVRTEWSAWSANEIVGAIAAGPIGTVLTVTSPVAGSVTEFRGTGATAADIPTTGASAGDIAYTTNEGRWVVFSGGQWITAASTRISTHFGLLDETSDGLYQVLVVNPSSIHSYINQDNTLMASVSFADIATAYAHILEYETELAQPLGDDAAFQSNITYVYYDEALGYMNRITGYQEAVAGNPVWNQVGSSSGGMGTVTADAVRQLLGLTSDEANDLLTNAVIASTSNGFQITFTQNDGTSIALAIPVGAADGVVSSAALNNGVLTLTLTEGGPVTVNLNDLISSNSEIDARIAAWARHNSPSGTIPLARIPSGVMLDIEFTAATIRNLLDLTSAEVSNLLTGASINSNTLTFTQNDGSTVTIAIPSTGGTGTADGVVTAGAINADATSLTLTVDTGGVETEVVIDIPAALRSASVGVSSLVKPIVTELGRAEDLAVDTWTNLQKSNANITYAGLSNEGIYRLRINSATTGDEVGEILPKFYKSDFGSDSEHILRFKTQLLASNLSSFGHETISLRMHSGGTVQVAAHRSDTNLIALEQLSGGITGGAVDLDGISLVDVTDTHHPTEAVAGNRKVEFDFENGQIWMSRDEHIAVTPAVGSAIDVTIENHFKGARLIHPTLPVEDDYYYSYRNGAHHWWDSIIDPTYGLVWSGVQFGFIAANKAEFDVDSVWLGEQFDATAAAAVVRNYSADTSYYFYATSRSRVQKMTNADYVAGISEANIPRYSSFKAGQEPLEASLGEDTTITFTADSELVSTGVIVPYTEIGLWSAIKFGGWDDSWHWFLSQDLRDKATAAAGDAASELNSIPIRSGSILFQLSRTSQDDLLVAVNPAADVTVSEIEIRTD